VLGDKVFAVGTYQDDTLVARSVSVLFYFGDGRWSSSGGSPRVVTSTGNLSADDATLYIDNSGTRLLSASELKEGEAVEVTYRVDYSASRAHAVVINPA
jgi:hypothetical protein